MFSLKEYILEAISNTQIFEMAYNRQQLIKRIEGLYKQIIENWVLVKYCTLTNRTQLKEHWRNELDAHLMNIFDMIYKGDKQYTISWVLIDKLELTTTDKIKNLTLVKFRKEHIDLSDKNYIKACNMFCEELYKIIQLISNKQTEENINKLSDYIESI